MTGLAWLLIRRIYFVPSILIFAVTLAWTWNMFGYRYGVWTSTSYMAYATLQVAGPVLAASGAWAAVRLTSGRTTFGLPHLARARSGNHGLHLGVGISCMLLAYICGLLPMFIFTAVTASYGGPGPLQLLNGLVSAVAFVCVGYALGRLLPWPIMPPVVAVMVYLIGGLAERSESTKIAAMTPVRSHLPTVPWIVENPIVLASQTALYALLALSAWWGVITYVSMHRKPRWQRTPAGLTVVALPLLLPLLVAWNPPLQHVLTKERMPEQVCVEASTYEVCVHPALAGDISEAASVVENLVELYGGRPPTHARTFQAGVASELGGPLGFYISPDQPVHYYASTSLPAGLAGMHTCYDKHGFDDETDPAYVTPESLRISDTVRAWLTTKMAVEPTQAAVEPVEGGEEYFHRLYSLPDEQVSAWIGERRDELFACEATADMLP